MSAQTFITELELEKHSEGGWFKRIYQSPHKLFLPHNQGERLASTMIYYLLEGNDFSAFHRLRSDEIWNFYHGATITLYLIDTYGKLEKKLLGHASKNTSTSFHMLIPANTWFAAEVNDPTSFALMGCFVTPGFEYIDFELANQKELINLYPEHTDLIRRLTRLR